MKARPILFKPEMILAWLREIEKPGTGKRQTRRVVKGDIRDEWSIYATLNGQPLIGCRAVLGQCPYGKPGDLLWARETWAEDVAGIHFRATEPDFPAPELGGWRPSIYMPRWASRITIQLTEVRVERLQDISEEDAKAEGCAPSWLDEDDNDTVHASALPTYRRGYARLWREINGPGSWDANPWVWVLTGKPHLVNVDEFIRMESKLLTQATDRAEKAEADLARLTGELEQVKADRDLHKGMRQLGWSSFDCPVCETHMAGNMPPEAKATSERLDRLTEEKEWLLSHCRAIGMVKPSLSGVWGHDIALFTVELKDRAEKAEKENAALRKDAERWECIEKLLERGGTVILSGDGEPNEWFCGSGENLESFMKMCPAAEFPAHAVAAIAAIKEKS